jgi:hypothetical protein
MLANMELVALAETLKCMVMALLPEVPAAGVSRRGWDLQSSSQVGL